MPWYIEIPLTIDLWFGVGFCITYVLAHFID